MTNSEILRELIQEAIELLTEKLSNLKNQLKPVLTHSIAVGSFLWHKGYSQEIVLAGFLHDVVEDSDATIEDLAIVYGEDVARIVSLCTKDEQIEDKVARRKELVERACTTKESAIVKAADTIDNYNYYKSASKNEGIRYCKQNVEFFKEAGGAEYNDSVIEEMFDLVNY